MLLQLAPWFGYLASLLLAIGLIINNDLKFRWLNTGGNIAFITYGILLHAMPVVLTNSLLLSINLFYLYKIYTRKELFELVEINPDNILVEKFLSYYNKDISDYFPSFRKEQTEGAINFVVLRNLVIANIFSARLPDNGNAEVIINYTVTKYRDFKVGRFIFEQEKEFLQLKGIKKLVYTRVENNQHKQFLVSMGFKEEMIAGQNCIVKML
jgi:hypothetical protein